MNALSQQASGGGGGCGWQQTCVRLTLDAQDGSPGFPDSITCKCRFGGHSHSLLVLQCSALQAQVTALKEQNAQHLKDLENKPQVSGVEAATADPSEKVSWYISEVNHVIAGLNVHIRASERMWSICGVGSFLPPLMLASVHHLSNLSQH